MRGARGLDDVHDVLTTREAVLLSRGQRIIAVFDNVDIDGFQGVVIK